MKFLILSMAQRFRGKVGNVYSYGIFTELEICFIKINILCNIQGVSKKGNPTLAWHCALITGCMNVIFAWS